MGFPIDNTNKNTNKNANKNASNSATGNGQAASDSRAESMSVAQWIAVAGGLGLSPIAPGTFGSVGGVVLFVGVFWMGADNPNPFALAGGYFSLIGVLFGLGVWASGQAEREWASHDDNRIVIDEVVGQLIALSPLVWLFGNWAATGSGPLAEHRPQAISSISFLVVTGFVLFRLFDVWKPGPVGWAERRFESGLGVMADDVMAGLFSAMVLVLVLLLLPGLVWKIAAICTEWDGSLSGVGFRSLGLGTEGLA